MIPIPTGPPPRPNLVPVSPEWERARKVRLLLTGLVLLIASPVVAVVEALWMYFLPISDDPFSWLGLLLTGTAALFCWLLGLCSVLSQSYFKRGAVDIAGVRPLLRQAVVLCLGTASVNAFSLFFLVFVSADRADELDASISFYLVIAALPMIMALVCCVQMFKCLRPERRS